MQALQPVNASFAVPSLTDVQALHPLLKQISTRGPTSHPDKAKKQALAASILLRQAAVCLLHFGVRAPESALLIEGMSTSSNTYISPGELPVTF